jgi:SAM-dependent methyltransferase
MNGSPAEAAAPRAPTAARREALLRRLGLEPSTSEVLRFFLDAALPAEGARVLDAGCGRVSAMVPFRERIAEFVGADIQPPDPLPGWMDRFVRTDICREPGAFPEATFDTVLSSFTIEHFADPPAALSTLHGWLRPGGSIVITTVNRGHPFVNAYLSMPRVVVRPLQRLVKASAADAHPLVGACNTPAALRDALAAAGFTEIELATTDHLARAWSRRLPAYIAGLIGDLAAHRFPARRSTIVARAVRPASGEA